MQITLKTLQQQTFKIDIDGEETVRGDGSIMRGFRRVDGTPRENWQKLTEMCIFPFGRRVTFPSCVFNYFTALVNLVE